MTSSVVALMGEGDPMTVCGYDGDPAGAAGLRFSGFLSRGWALVQSGRGIAVMFAKTATIAAAQGQVRGIRSRRCRPLWVSRAGTCQSR